ncbi:hypothetical protein [Sinorhizobium fredii]|nr:hypothetical protein [Sinorhizobium fredii]
MTQIDLGWGEGPSERYETLAEQFRPLWNGDVGVCPAHECPHLAGVGV